MFSIATLSAIAPFVKFFRGNFTDMIGGVATSELEEAVVAFTKLIIRNRPEMVEVLKGLPKLGVRISVTGLISVLKQRRDRFGPGNEKLVEMFNEVIEALAEGVARGATEFDEDLANRVARKIAVEDKGADGNTIKYPFVEGMWHPIPIRADGTCPAICQPLERDKLRQESVRRPAPAPRRGGRDPDPVPVPVELQPYKPQDSVTLEEAEEQGIPRCPHHGNKDLASPVVDKAEKPKLWHDEYGLEYMDRIRYLYWLFEAKLHKADVLEHLNVVPSRMLMSLLDDHATPDKKRLVDIVVQVDPVTTEKIDVVSSVLGLLKGNSSTLNETAREQVERAYKDWNESSNPAVAATIQAAKATTSAVAKGVGKFAAFVVACLCVSLVLFGCNWIEGWSVSWALGTTGAVWAFSIGLLAFVIPMDALADLVRGFLGRFFGDKAVVNLDLNKVKYGIGSFAAQIVFYGILLTAVLWRATGVDSEGARGLLFVAFLATQAISLLVWANPVLFYFFKERAKNTMVFALVGVVVIAILVAVFGWVLPILGKMTVFATILTFIGVGGSVSGPTAWWFWGVALLAVGLVGFISFGYLLRQKVATTGFEFLRVLAVGASLLAMIASPVVLYTSWSNHHDAEKAAAAAQYQQQIQQTQPVVQPTTTPTQVVRHTPPAAKTSPKSKDTGKKGKQTETRQHSTKYCRGNYTTKTGINTCCDMVPANKRAGCKVL